MRIRHLALAGLTTLTAVGVAALAPPTATAGADTALPSSFEVSAVADGLRVSTTIPGAPLSDGLVDVSTSTASAVIDAVGVSRSYAAVPYPGATLTNLPDVLRGASGAPIPTYPLVAAADHPTVPESAVTQPGLSLRARGAAGTAEATLSSGAAGDDATAAGQATGHTLVTAADDGTLSAEATSSFAALALGPLRIARVASLARVARSGAGEPRREQSLEVTGLSVAGQALGVGPQGLTAGSGTVPLPDSHPARAALESAGIAVRYLEPVETPDGILAAGLVVSQVIPASPTGQPSQVTYTVGRSRAQVVVGAAAPTPDEASSALPASPTEGAGPPASGTADGVGPVLPGPPNVMAAAAPSLSPAQNGGAVPATAPSTSVPASPDTDTADPPALQTLPAAAPVLATGGPPRRVELWSATFFAVPASAGVLVLFLFLALRSLGVKSTWVS